MLYPAGKPPHMSPWLQPRPSNEYEARPPRGAYHDYQLCTPCQSAVRTAWVGANLRVRLPSTVRTLTPQGCGGGVLRACDRSRLTRITAAHVTRVC